MKITTPYHQSASTQPGGPGFSLAPNKMAAGSIRLTRTTPGHPLEALDALAQWQAGEIAADAEAVFWPLEKMPLTIYVEPHPELPEGVKDFMLAFRQWEAASQGLIRFEATSASPVAPDTADIILTWSRTTTLGRDYEVGHTRRELQGNRINRAVITLIESPLIDAHLSPEKRKLRLFSTVLHEAGHALGLEHSDAAGDVMHHRGWQRTLLSQNDIKRLQKLYQAQTRRIG